MFLPLRNVDKIVKQCAATHICDCCGSHWNPHSNSFMKLMNEIKFLNLCLFLSSSLYCDTDKEGKFVPDKDQVNTPVYNSHCLPRVVGSALKV